VSNIKYKKKNEDIKELDKREMKRIKEGGIGNMRK
jgi:hypothetical protein